MIDRLYLFIGGILIVCTVAFMVALFYVLRPYTEMLGQGLALVFMVACVCSCFIMGAATWSIIRIVNAIALNKINKVPLLTHKDYAVLLDSNGMPYHVSAIHNSAHQTAFALEQAAESTRYQEELQAHVNRDSPETKVQTVIQMVGKGETQRAIAQALQISTTKLRSDYSDYLPAKK